MKLVTTAFVEVRTDSAAPRSQSARSIPVLEPSSSSEDPEQPQRAQARNSDEVPLPFGAAVVDVVGAEHDGDRELAPATGEAHFLAFTTRQAPSAPASFAANAPHSLERAAPRASKAALGEGHPIGGSLGLELHRDVLVRPQPLDRERLGTLARRLQGDPRAVRIVRSSFAEPREPVARGQLRDRPSNTSVACAFAVSDRVGESNWSFHMRHFSIACTLALAALSPQARAQQLVRTVNGLAGSQYGKACLVVPDQNADGVKDVLVGAPGHNSNRGAVYCLSGAYLASGVGVQHVWGVVPAVNPGDRFGATLANVGDVTGDGVVDFLVGEPGFSADRGAVRLINGSSHSVGAELSGIQSGGRFGTAIAALSDLTGDGRREVAVGAPGSSSGTSQVIILKGNGLAAGGALTSLNSLGSIYSGSEYGTSLASGFDFDGDGYDDLVVGDPGADNATSVDAGAVVILSVPPTNIQGLGYFLSAVPGERFGQVLSMASDYDGDGAWDIVVGAPNALDPLGGEAGHAVVLSGGKLVNQTPPYEIYSYGNTGGGSGWDFHFGAAVRATGDLNGDGVGEFLIGAPDYWPLTPLNVRGAATLYSGATGAALCTIVGGSSEQLGDGLAGAVDDLDGDGFKEFVVAGALANNAGTDSGVVKCYRLFPLAPSIYCTGKINSLGCTPSISYSGSPSANPSAPFNITATNFVNQKNGLLFYSHAPVSVLFQGGFLCVRSPTVRTQPQNSGGAASGSSCSGTYSFDFNAWFTSGWDTSLDAGSEVFAQYWSRDPASPSHTGLSNALRFVINP